jgi:adenylate cyclase class IV
MTYEHPDGGVSIALDEIPELGYFIEIEGGLAKIQDMERRLKAFLGPQERRNYAEVFRAYKLEKGGRLEEIKGASFTLP